MRTFQVEDFVSILEFRLGEQEGQWGIRDYEPTLLVDQTEVLAGAVRFEELEGSEQAEPVVVKALVGEMALSESRRRR